MEIDPAYQSITKKDKRPQGQRWRHCKHANSGRTPIDNNQSDSRSAKQVASQLWRNSDNPLLIKMCADDVVKKGDESFATEPNNPENKTPLKTLRIPCLYKMYNFEWYNRIWQDSIDLMYDSLHSTIFKSQNYVWLIIFTEWF